MASPKAIVTDVEHVGAKFNGQASLTTEASNVTSACLLNVELVFPVITITLMSLILAMCASFINSSVSPLLEIKSNRSFFLNIPISP